MENIQEVLEWIWLWKNESKIYITLLELWKSWITSISKKSWIKRSTIYNYITPLLGKDFIKRSISWKRVLFIAENPNNLVKAFEERKNNFIKKLPLLEWIYNENHTNTNLEFYEWKNWIKKIYKEISLSGQSVLAFFSPKKFYDIFSEEYDSYLSNLQRKSWWEIKNLLKNDTFWKDHLKADFTSNNSKLLPESFDFDVDIIIIKNTIVMVSFEPLYVIKLKNKWLSDFHRNIFNYLWKI